MNFILRDPILLGVVIWLGLSFIGTILMLLADNKSLWNEWECFGPGPELIGMGIGGPITLVLGIIAILRKPDKYPGIHGPW